MSVPIIAFFNNKGGVGKTSLVYHLAWMYADLGLRVVMADLDPQANLTAASLDEEQVEDLWNSEYPKTVFGTVQPLIKGIGDIAEPYLAPVGQPLFPTLMLLPGDLSLSRFEDTLSEVWPKCMDRDERAFRVISAFWRIIQKAIAAHHAQVVLVDLGPNLGAINRAVLIAADYVVVPLSPDLYSLQGLHNLGPTLHRWRGEWTERLSRNPAKDLLLPSGQMLPIGYVVLQHSVRLDRPVQSYNRWIARIPQVYRTDILQQGEDKSISITKDPPNDPHCLKLLKHYRSLMPMAQEARKPIFHLKPADGAIGSHLQAVHSAYQDFKQLAIEIAKRTGDFL